MTDPVQTTRPPLEIRHNEDGSLDEVVADNATVHLEQMSDKSWWMSVETAGQLVHVNFWSRGKIRARAERAP